ncbi:MAG: L-threonylcarbamoyladenylate synthase [Nanoarchaeota archaeon]|nr:L-threonylcarbamoyladenylate synthase [Nanoarchaeota archaeon]
MNRLINKDECWLKPEEINKEIAKGAVFIYPTDTIYGLGCDATNSKAVSKIRELKERPKQAFSIIAPSKDWIVQNCELGKEAKEWLEKLPGPYTLILKLKNKKAISKEVNEGLDTIGVRIPKHWIAGIIRTYGKPIVTTSANKVGKMFMTNLDDLDADIKAKVDFIIYEDEKKGNPSTLVNLSGEEATITKRTK